MQYFELAVKKLCFIVTPDELRAILNDFHHVVVNTSVPENYVESDPEEFFSDYEKLYQKLKNGEKLTNSFFAVGITAHPENCVYKSTSKLSVPDFAQPCPIIDTFCFLPYRGTLSTSFSVLQYPENTCGLCLSFPMKVEYSASGCIVTQDALDDFETFQVLVSRIKDITKPLKLNFDGKPHRTAVRISDGAKMDFGKFYFAASNGIEVI
jgi:hypothetical protein